MRFFYLYIFFILSIVEGFSQQIFFSKKELPLPSQETYSISQDGEGYIWIATDQGFCRYDGKNLKVFDGKNGLPENSVYAVRKSKDGRIWGVTVNHRLIFTYRGEVKESKFSKILQAERSLSSVNYIHTIKLLEDENKIIANSFYSVFTFSLEDDKIEKHAPAEANSLKDTTLLFYQSKDFLVQMNAGVYNGMGDLNICIVDTATQTQIRIEHISLYTNHGSKFPQTIQIGNKKYITFANYVFCIDEKQQLSKKELPSRILYLYGDKDGGVWVGTLGNGVFYFKTGDITASCIHSLRELSVSGVLEDVEGNIWVSTLEKGIFFSKNKHIITYHYEPELNKMGTVLARFNNKAYFSSSLGTLVAVQGDRVEYVTVAGKIKEAITGIAEFKNEIYLGNKYATFKTDSTFQENRRLKWEETQSTVFALILEHDGKSLYGSANNTIFRIDDLTASELIIMPFYIRDFEYIDNNQWLLGGNALFLCNFENGKCEELRQLGFPISDICFVGGKLALIATRGGGLFVYKNREVISLKKQLGLPTDVIYDITEDKEHNIWLGTNQGVIKINTVDKKVAVFSVDDGLISNQVFKILIIDQQIYMSTASGLCSMDLSKELKKSTAPIIHLNTIFINEKEVNEGFLKPIRYKNNSITFSFDVMYYKSSASDRLVYVLKQGKEVSYRNVIGNQISLQNLSSGEYELNVFTENHNGVISNIYTTQFEISKPLWQQWHFVILEILAVVAFLYGFIQLYIRRIKKIEAEKTKVNDMIANSRLTALQAQMNPHFVFNSINSIQNFVLKNEAEQAYAYLTKFSRLIRLVLQYSRRKFISVQDELELLRLYVSLERLRFENQFEYEEHIDPTIDLNHLSIPPMLIQPFVENAIWHGITPITKDRIGKIQLRMFQENKMLKIEIEDNGVGRNFKKKEGVYESLSLKLVEERVQVVNSLYKDNKASMLVVDLMNEQNQPVGTKIILTFPI